MDHQTPPQVSVRTRGAIDASMWIYLWDLVDEGYDHVLPFLKERGITSLSLACAYHAGKFLTPHNPKRKVVFLEDGTIYFRHDPSLFGTIAPLPNSLVGEGHHLGEAMRHAEAYGMETRAWLVCCHNSRIGLLHTDACGETAHGDKLIHNLCPNNNDVRAYLRGLVRSVAAHGVRTIELEALQFQGYSHGMHHEREGIALPLHVRYLLGLCFCPSCLRAARALRVPIDRVRAWTKRALDDHFAEPSLFAHDEEGFGELPHELFGPFELWREECILDAASELAETAAAFGAAVLPMTSLARTARRLAAVNPMKLSQATGGLLALGYMKEEEKLRAALGAMQREVGSRPLTLGLQAGMPESGGEVEFLERAAAARQMGITRFNFYNYGFIPLANMEWIAQALA